MIPLQEGKFLNFDSSVPPSKRGNLAASQKSPMIMGAIAPSSMGQSNFLRSILKVVKYKNSSLNYQVR